MPTPLRWGILGTGNIARQFCTGVNASRRGQFAAVGSRTADSARAFADAFRVAAAHGSYDALLADPTVEAVYVSLPNSMHHEWTLKALVAGKHVLCEKPMAVNAAQAGEMFDAARRAGRVLVEAFMYRAHPLTHAVLAAVRRGDIGDVRLVRTSFCYRTSKTAGNVRFRPDLAGGALMDVGCYCVNFARLIAGAEPTHVLATGQLHESGVDQLVAGTLAFPGGLVASFTCGMNVQADNTAYVCGSDGYLEIPVPWKPPATAAAYTVARQTPPRMDNPATPAPPPRQTHTIDAGGELYGVEADDFAATVHDGKPPLVTPDDTLGNMRVLDELRRQIGLLY